MPGRLSPETDLYNLLGVDSGASQPVIKQAYKRQVFRHHPDRDGSPKRFKEIVSAYEILSNLEKRAEYDQTHLQNQTAFEYTLQGTVKIRKEAQDRLVAIINNRLREIE